MWSNLLLLAVAATTVQGQRDGAVGTSGTTTTTTTSGTSGTSGTPCHPGNYRDPTGACNACAAGKSQPFENQPQCKDCPVHQYQDLIGSTSCKPCSSATAVGSTTCVAASGNGSASDGQWQGLNNGESACEGHDDFDAEKCNAVGCCVWDSDYAYCRSDIGTAACSGSTWTVPTCSPCTAYATTDEDGSQAATEEGKMHYQQDSDGKCWSIE